MLNIFLTLARPLRLPFDHYATGFRLIFSQSTPY